MILGWALLGWATLVAAVSAVAVVRRARARPLPRGVVHRPVLLVRPCAGAEPGLLERLEVSPPGARVRLSVTDAEDPARPIVEQACAALRARGIDAEYAVVPSAAPNLKAAQLEHWFDAAPAEAVLVNADSDVDLRGFDLDGLVGPLCMNDALGATWSPPAEHAPRTRADHASAAFLGASLHAFTLLGTLDPAGLVGKLFAVRVDRLRAAGGMAGLARCLGEDMEIARRLRAAGHGVAMHPAVVRSMAQGRTHAGVIGRYARWLAVIRAQRPALLASYPLLFGATTPLVILGACVTPWAPLGALAAALALAARCAVAAAGRRFNQLEGMPLWRAVLDGERVTWAAFLTAITRREVEWRGRRLRVGADGRVQPVSPEAARAAD